LNEMEMDPEEWEEIEQEAEPQEKAAEALDAEEDSDEEKSEEGSEEKQTTYERIDDTEEEVVELYMTKLREFGITVPEKHKQFAEIYMTGKMHKVIPKMRYIAASRNCMTKTLSAILTKVLRQVQHQHRFICRERKRATGLDAMWIADSSAMVLTQIDELRESRRAVTVDTYDFTDLYTNIPHAALKHEIHRLIDEAFESQRDMQFINTASYYGRWVERKQSKGLNIDSDTAKRMVSLLIDNIYVTVGSRAFRQVIGIPMGTDCAPYLANLYLYARERSWLENRYRAADWKTLQHFKYCSRFIDDLNTFNNADMIERHSSEIYGGLQLKKESAPDSKSAHFLEVDMLVQGNFVHTGLYDKRDAFDFRVVTFPTLPANQDPVASHGLIIAQLIRYARVTDTPTALLHRSRMLTDRLLDQGFYRQLLQQKCGVFFDRHHKEIRKFALTKEQLIAGCFNGSPEQQHHSPEREALLTAEPERKEEQRERKKRKRGNMRLKQKRAASIA
jgi:hypothetical protein